MDPLSVTASIIAVIQLTGSVVSAIYNYRKGAKHAPEDAATMIQELTALSQILEKILRMIEKDRSSKGTRLESLDGLVKPDGPLESCQKTLERLNTKLQPENGWRAIKQSLTWPLKQDYVKKTLSEIETTKATLGLALSTDQVSLALETKDSIDALTSSLETSKIDQERKEILSHLSPTDATINHLRACKKHQKGTGDWFTKSEGYLKWAATGESILWIHGIPGCGKTILCSKTIEDLQNYKTNKPRSVVAYYYFNFQNKAEQQFVNLLRSIALQLSCQCPNLPLSLKILKRRPKFEFSNEDLIDIVRETLKSFHDVYIVIDAVDECEQSEEVLRWIQDLVESQDPRLHLLISSRQDHHFRKALLSSPTSIVALDEHTFELDIQLYIREQLSTDPRMMRWPVSVRDDVEQSLMANAGGLFRWVDCQLDVLRKCIRVNNIKAVLSTPPKTLNETYDRIIGSIDEAYVEDACKILQWLAFSARPLRTKELNEVLAFDLSDPQNPTFSPSLRLPLLEDVLTLCSSLVTVSDKNSTGPVESNIGSLEVCLAHNSVKDYLVSRHTKSGPSTQFALEERLAHSVMAECCLVYLLQFQSQLDAAMIQEFPLAPYAAQFWTEHYRHSEASDGDLLDRLALQLLTTEKVYQNCCCLYSPDRRWRGIQVRSDLRLPPLYYASLTGLSRMIMPLVANGANPNEDARGCYLGDALSAAAYKGDEDSLQALLSAGAKPDGGAWQGEYGSPIASSASQGHNAIVRLLLKAGANVNERGEDGQGPALYHAVSYRHLETVKMLLDAGASADACAGMSGVVYAISIAAKRGDRDPVCLLFPKVSDWAAAQAMGELARAGHREVFETLLTTQRGKEIGLQYAASAGWNDLVQSIIDKSSHDAEMELSTKAALCKAAAAGSLETTQIIYENSVEKTVSTEELSEAVASAASRGNSLVVKYLLDRGADIRSEICQQGLVQAAERGHLSTVHILLTAGVSPNSSYKTWRSSGLKSCLWAAVDQQRVEIARLLLAFGADPNTRCNEISALNTAIRKANEELFDLLLEKGPSTAIGRIDEARYDTLELPVHYAASGGSVYILRRLLEAGHEADSALIADSWTALFHAAKAGHEAILSILIHDYGVDVHRRANKGTLAIHTAAYHNHGKCVEVFLDGGLDVDVRGRAGRTSLHWAAQEGSIDAVRVLLERGADVFIEEKDTFMKAADIAKVKALEVAESRKSEYHWKQPREENYEPILQMLEQAAQSHHGPARHSSTFRRRLSSLGRRRESRDMSPP